MGGANDVQKYGRSHKRCNTVTGELLSKRRGGKFFLVGEQLGGAGLFPLDQHGMTEMNISSLL